jgi:hypothetical protein
LEEQHGAVRRPQQQGVEDGDVDAVMEEFDSDDDPHASPLEVC